MAKQNKNMTMTEVGVCCIAAGAMGSVMLGMPALGILLNGAGVYSIIYDTFWKTNSHKKFFTNSGLCIGSGDNALIPRVVEKKETYYGEELKIKAPVGMSSKTFEEKSIEFKEYFKVDKVEFKAKNGFIFAYLYKVKLKDHYDFKIPEKVEAVIEFPIGYSRKGLETIKLNEVEPHCLIAGMAGSGKSVTLRGIITSLMLLNDPKMLRMHLVDGKGGAEFGIFRDSDFVETFIKDTDDALQMLEVISEKIESRYDLFYKKNVVDIAEYNKKFKNHPLPYELIVIDEFAELRKDKDSLDILETVSQKARACGIHLIIATQRPDAKIVNGRIKANFPIVVGLRCLNQTNSQIIWGEKGGLDKLRGKGHCMVRKDEGQEVEVQSMFISPHKAKKLVNDKNKQIQKKNSVPNNQPAHFLSKKDGGEGLNSNNEQKSKSKIKDFSFLELLDGDNSGKKISGK